MTSIFPIILVSILALALISFGMILFILGLILKKPGQWLPGIIITVVSFLFGIFVFIYFVKNSIDRAKTETHFQYDGPQDDGSQSNESYQAQPETPAEIAEPPTEEQVSGFIQDADKSLVFIKITPDVLLSDYGITLEKIDTYAKSMKNKKTISLLMHFTTKCKGDMVLILYSSDDEELGRSKIQVNQEGNTSFTMKFVFPDETDFLRANHAHLKISD